MKRVFSALILCVVLSCTHAVRVERSLLQAPSANVSRGPPCPRSSILLNGRCYAIPTVSEQEIETESESLGRTFAEAIEQAENGGNVSTIASTFSAVLTRTCSRIFSNAVLAVIEPENEDICRYTGRNAGYLATSMTQVVALTFARSANEYAIAAIRCFAEAVAYYSVGPLQRLALGECTNFGAEFVYNRMDAFDFTDTISRHASTLLTGVLDRDETVGEAICDSIVGRR